MHTSRRLRKSITVRAATALALALSLAACTNKVVAPDEPTSATSPTVTDSLTPTPAPIPRPTFPESGNSATVDGAVAAAKYFMAVYTYARQSGDLSEWNALAADDCTFCNAVSASVKAAVDAGHTVTGATVSVLESAGSEITAGEWYTATLRVDEAPSQESDRSGRVLTEGGGGPHDLFFAISWNDGWQIDAVDVNATPSK